MHVAILVLPGFAALGHMTRAAGIARRVARSAAKARLMQIAVHFGWGNAEDHTQHLFRSRARERW